MDTTTTLISIKASYACPHCGCINLQRHEEMDKEIFEQKARSNPGEFWKEDQSGQTVYRHHEEGDEGKCRRSC